MVVTAAEHPSGINALGNIEHFGELIDRLGVSKIVEYGHSYMYGGVTTVGERDVAAHFAGAMKAQEVALAQGGAILSWHQTGATGDGGFAKILNEEIRNNTTKPQTTLNALASAGATTISLTSRTGIALNDALMVGTGASGSGGGEVVFATSTGTGAGTITFRRPTGETTLARTHQSGEGVYWVPTGSINQNSMYLFWYGNNDLAAGAIAASHSSLSAYRERFTHPLRACLARMRCADVYEQDHVSCVYTGSWGAHGGAASVNSGGTARGTTAVDAAVTIHVPDNFEGGTVVLGFEWPVQNVANNSIWSFTVDGVAAGTLTMQKGYTVSATYDAAVKRLTGLSAGRHVIVATNTQLQTGGGIALFDWWGIEAPNPPVIVVFGAVRPYRYDIVWPTWPNRRQTGQLNMATVPIGTTAWTFDALTVAPDAGTTFTIGEGTGDAESLEVAASPTPTTTTCTTTTASTIAHADNDPITVGMQDADIPKLNTLINSVIAEFANADGSNQVIFFDPDAVFNKNPIYFFSDGAHFNDLGHAALTEPLRDTVLRSRGFTPRVTAYTAVPSLPFPLTVVYSSFCGSAPSVVNDAWVNQPAALTEFCGATAFRRTLDLTKYLYWRLRVGVLVNLGSGATTACRLQYSLDAGTTWKYFGRSALYAEDGTVGEVAALNAAGSKEGAWSLLPSEVRLKEILTRVIGINGNATADPTFLVSADFK